MVLYCLLSVAKIHVNLLQCTQRNFLFLLSDKQCHNLHFNISNIIVPTVVKMWRNVVELNIWILTNCPRPFRSPHCHQFLLQCCSPVLYSEEVKSSSVFLLCHMHYQVSSSSWRGTVIKWKGSPIELQEPSDHGVPGAPKIYFKH